MRKILLLLTVLACSAVARSQERPVNARPSPVVQNGCTDAADVNAIRRIPVLWKNNYNSGNAAGVAALYAENADYLTQHFISGIVHGRAAIQAYVQLGVAAHYHIDSIQILSMGCSGNLAYTVGRYEATNAGQKAMGVNLVVLRKIKGRWLIVAHEAAVPDPSAAVRHLDINQSQ
jgi:ketosteroid isomerase-like protein